MDYEMFKSFIHPELIFAFMESDEEGNNSESTLLNSFNLATNDYQQLARKLSEENIVPKFDEQTYILKKGFYLVYTWILQNKAFLMNINLTGLGISDSEVFEHFLALRNSEEDDLDKMRKEVLDEYQDATKSGSSGARLNHIPNKNCFRLNRRW